jgi:hypothetical protein
MPPQTQPDQAPADQACPDQAPVHASPRVSRRSLLRGAAGAGAIGFAAAAGGAAFAASAGPAAAPKAPSPKDVAAPGGPSEPLVVYLRDAKSGEFEIFNGTRQVKITNHRLVAQLLDGLQAAQ